MPTFEAVIRSPAGAVSALSLAAVDDGDARRQAGADGSTVLSCHPAHARRLGMATASVGRGRPDAATFAHELGSLIAAGMPVVQALQTLAGAQRAAPARERVNEVVAAVGQGLRLSDAMDRVKGAFPPLLVATVRASEQTGDLPTSLFRFAQHQQSFKSLRDKALGAALYPALLLLLGSLVVGFLLAFVVPKFALLIESTRHELPWSSQLLMSWGRLVAENGGPAAAVAAVLLAIAVLGARRLAAQGTHAAWIAHLPLVGALVREFQRSQLYRTAGLLVQGGTPLPRALALCLDLLNVEDRARLQRCITLIEEGRPLAAAFAESELADPAAAGMLSVAERTGTLGPILERVASFKELRLQRAVEWTSRLVEPALMIVIGLVIGGIVVLMYLPIFDLAASLQ